MKKHTKIYMAAMGYSVGDFILCEVCGKPASEIHHIHRRGMGGATKADAPENLMAVCRRCHVEYGDKRQCKDWLKQVHWEAMVKNGCNPCKNEPELDAEQR